MTADLEQLLAVQGHDTLATQLRTRRQNLPERAEAAEVAAAVDEVTRRLAGLDEQRHRLDREQARIEDEVASLRDKAAQADKALYSGTVTNPRELQALQDEVASLARRVGELEDEELELLVEREPLDEGAAAATTEREGLLARADDLLARLTAAEAEIDAELDAVAARREAAAAEVPDDLLAEYEGLRASGGGVGVARLEHGTTCGGCHIQLSAMERDRIGGLPPDARVHCEECGRLLVR